MVTASPRNLLVLPDGACYGNLDADTAVDVVTSHLQGRVDVDHLRGVSTQPPVAQAAIAAALRRFGPAALSQVGVSARRATRVGGVAGHPHRHRTRAAEGGGDRAAHPHGSGPAHLPGRRPHLGLPLRGP